MMLMLRLCDENDIDTIFKFSNDPTVRANAFNTSNIKYEDHCKWYSESLQNENRRMYIVEKDRVQIGQIRLDKEKNKALISYSIEKSNRGKGYGKEILGLIKNEAKINHIEILEGLVKKNNIASIKAFKANQFEEVEENTYLKYTYLLKDGNGCEINKNS